MQRSSVQRNNCVNPVLSDDVPLRVVLSEVPAGGNTSAFSKHATARMADELNLETSEISSNFELPRD